MTIEVDRFLAKVVPGAGQDDCWEWTACKTKQGYGKVNAGGVTQGAHRAAYGFFVGPIPDGLQVLHHCDNPGCTNPQHLFLGTNADNMADKVAKGRSSRATGAHGARNGANTRPERRPRGALNGSSKLSESKVLEIRELRAAGITLLAIAYRMGVSESAVSLIVSRKAWAHVA